jgi:hypothetical protein
MGIGVQVAISGAMPIIYQVSYLYQLYHFHKAGISLNPNYATIILWHLQEQLLEKQHQPQQQEITN